MVTQTATLLTSAPLRATRPSPPPPLRRHRLRTRRNALAVGALMVLAFALEVPTIARSYWIDEAISVGIASHPLRQLPPLLRNDGSPPLWYVLLHFWMLAFGSTPVATHTLTLLCTLAVVPTAYWCGRTLFGPRSGLCCAALAATNPFLTWYATETRMYTLVVGLAMVAITLTARAVQDRDRRYAVAAVVAFAAVDYTHYWGLYLTVVTAAFLVVRAHRAGDRDLRTWAIGGAAGVGLLYLPWLPSFFEQAGNTGAPWAVAPGIGDFFADPSTSLAGTAGCVVVPLLAIVAVATAWDRRVLRCDDPAAAAAHRATMLIIPVTAGTIVLGWLVAQVEPSWTVRYLAVTIGPWLVGITGVLGATRAGRRAIGVMCLALAAFSVVGSLLPDSAPADTMDNGGAIAAAAAPYLHAGDLVVVTQTEQVPVLSYALGPRLVYANPLGVVADPSVVNWQDLVSSLQHADACATIGPAIAALPIGATILEVDPLDPVGASGSAWAIASHRQVLAIERLLPEDPSLRWVHAFTQDISPRPYSPLIGQLFVKVRASTTCM